MSRRVACPRPCAADFSDYARDAAATGVWSALLSSSAQVNGGWVGT
jgi:hypothetical protein